MTANNMEAAVMRTPLVAVAVAEVSPSAVPEVVVVSSVEVVAEVSAADSQVDDEEVVDPNEWLESQTVQTVAEEQVLHPVPQAVQRSTAAVVAAVVKNPSALHEQAVLSAFTTKLAAQVEHFTGVVAARSQVMHPLLHGV